MPDWVQGWQQVQPLTDKSMDLLTRSLGNLSNAWQGLGNSGINYLQREIDRRDLIDAKNKASNTQLILSKLNQADTLEDKERLLNAGYADFGAIRSMLNNGDFDERVVNDNLAKWDAGITQRFMANDMMKISTPEGQKAIEEWNRARISQNPELINKANSNPNLPLVYKMQGGEIGNQMNSLNWDRNFLTTQYNDQKKSEANLNNLVEKSAKDKRDALVKANLIGVDTDFTKFLATQNIQEREVHNNINSFVRDTSSEMFSNLREVYEGLTSPEDFIKNLAKNTLSTVNNYIGGLDKNLVQSYFNLQKQYLPGAFIKAGWTEQEVDNYFSTLSKDWGINNSSDTGSDKDIEQLRKDLTTTQTQITYAEDRLRGYDAQIAKAKTDKEKKKWEDLKARDTESLKQYKTKEENINKKILEKSKPVAESYEPEKINNGDINSGSAQNVENVKQQADSIFSQKDEEGKLLISDEDLGNVISSNPNAFKEVANQYQTRADDIKKTLVETTGEKDISKIPENKQTEEIKNLMNEHSDLIDRNYLINKSIKSIQEAGEEKQVKDKIDKVLTGELLPENNNNNNNNNEVKVSQEELNDYINTGNVLTDIANTADRNKQFVQENSNFYNQHKKYELGYDINILKDAVKDNPVLSKVLDNMAENINIDLSFDNKLETEQDKNKRTISQHLKNNHKTKISENIKKKVKILEKEINNRIKLLIEPLRQTAFKFRTDYSSTELSDEDESYFSGNILKAFETYADVNFKPKFFNVDEIVNYGSGDSSVGEKGRTSQEGRDAVKNILFTTALDREYAFYWFNDTITIRDNILNIVESSADKEVKKEVIKFVDAGFQNILGDKKFSKASDSQDNRLVALTEMALFMIQNQGTLDILNSYVDNKNNLVLDVGTFKNLAEYTGSIPDNFTYSSFQNINTTDTDKLISQASNYVVRDTSYGQSVSITDRNIDKHKKQRDNKLNKLSSEYLSNNQRTMSIPYYSKEAIEYWGKKYDIYEEYRKNVEKEKNKQAGNK